VFIDVVIVKSLRKFVTENLKQGRLKYVEGRHLNTSTKRAQPTEVNL